MSIWVAPLGWDHDAWQDDFYPADLPREWRLGFFANEFRVVVVPALVWQQASPALAAQWRDDTHDDFHFLLEATDRPPDAALLQALADRYAGLAGTGGLAVTPWLQGGDLRQLRDVIDTMPEHGVLLLKGAPPSLSVLRNALDLCRLLGRG